MMLGFPYNLSTLSNSQDEGVESTKSWWQQLEKEEQRQLKEIMDEETAKQLFEGEEVTSQ